MDFRLTLISLGIVGLLSIGIAFWIEAPYWLVFFAVAAAILLNGFVATVEDDLPGGFNNPDGTDTPAYVHKLTWAVRTLIVLMGSLTIFMLLLWKFG